MSMLCYFSPEAKPPRRRDNQAGGIRKDMCEELVSCVSKVCLYSKGQLRYLIIKTTIETLKNLGRFGLTLSLGTSNILESLVMVPTMTAIFSALSPFIFRTNRANDIGGRFICDIYNRRRTTSLNLASVRRARNLYSYRKQF